MRWFFQIRHEFVGRNLGVDLGQDDPALVVGPPGPVEQRLGVPQLELRRRLRIRQQKPRIVLFTAQLLGQLDVAAQTVVAAHTAVGRPGAVLVPLFQRPRGQDVPHRLVDVVVRRFEETAPIERSLLLDHGRVANPRFRGDHLHVRRILQGTLDQVHDRHAQGGCRRCSHRLVPPSPKTGRESGHRRRLWLLRFLLDTRTELAQPFLSVTAQVGAINQFRQEPVRRQVRPPDHFRGFPVRRGYHLGRRRGDRVTEGTPRGLLQLTGGDARAVAHWRVRRTDVRQLLHARQPRYAWLLGSYRRRLGFHEPADGQPEQHGHERRARPDDRECRVMALHDERVIPVQTSCHTFR